jgi:ankyrin repeat protein
MDPDSQDAVPPPPAGLDSAFEAAADAVVAGDADALRRLLGAHPDLVRTRSSREHHATLLHYVSANGVEQHRQRSPANAAAVAELLLDAGADVDSEADVYGGGCTPLGLVATSAPPRIAGVQQAVIDVLLAHGARMDHPGCTGNGSALVRGCLMNGCPEAARYLADRGAPLDFTAAAGVGRLDVVRRFVGPDGRRLEDLTEAALLEGFAVACGMGSVAVVEYLLDGGLGVDHELRLHGDGHTGLHVAAYHGEPGVVGVLLARGADVHRRDRTWGTPPLVWAVTGWDHAEAAGYDPSPYPAVARLLLAHGAESTPELRVRVAAGPIQGS